MMIKKCVALAMLLYCAGLRSSDSSQTSSSSAVKSVNDTFIVMLKNSEDLVSHRDGIIGTFTTASQQAEVYCPGNPEVLCRIRNILVPQKLAYCPRSPKALHEIHLKFVKRGRVTPEDPIELNTIIEPIFPIITDYLKQGLTNHSNFGFMVGPNQSVVPATFDTKGLHHCRLFILENNPIASEWFAPSVQKNSEK